MISIGSSLIACASNMVQLELEGDLGSIGGLATWGLKCWKAAPAVVSCKS